MHPGMAIDAFRDGDDASLNGYIASWDGNLEMAIDASPDGNRCIPSMHPGIAIDASRDGDHLHPV